MADFFRLFAGITLLGLAATTALPTPGRALWGASVAATEFGYWLAILALLPAIPTKSRTRPGRIGSMLSLASIPLLILPAYRAHEEGAKLPSAFESRFGAERRVRVPAAQDPRPEPLVWTELLTSLNLPPVRYEQHVFTQRDNQKLSFDLFRPAYVHDPIPAVIVVHGGGWQTGDSLDYRALNAYLASRDYVVISINYREAPKFRFPAQRDDVYAAIAYVKTHAADFGVDPSRLVLLGRSEGGQLALLAAYTAGEPSIRGVISLYAPTDLRVAYEHPTAAWMSDTRSALEQFMGGSPAKVEQAYFDASPINFVSAASPPTLLIHGLRDELVPADQSARLDDRLNQAGVKHLYIKLPWATHACDQSFAGPCGQITTYAVERFLDAVTIPTPPDPLPAAKRKLAKR
jgi:acetyl esterase/lipase